jgi:hypothetical protein
MGGKQAAQGERGASLRIDSVVGDAGGVYHTGDGETARSQGVWGELGVSDRLWGRSVGSGNVFRRSERPESRSKSGGTRGTGVVEYDVAARLGGSRCGTGVRGASWGDMGSVGIGADRRWGWLSQQGSFVE